MVTAVWVAVAVAALTFAAVVAVSLRAESSDGRAVAERELGIVTSTGDSARPPQRDLVVPLDTCGTDGTSLVAGGRLTNRSGEPSSYYVVALFRTPEKKLATSTVRIDDVPPDGTVTFQAAAPASTELPPSFKCRVTRVERWPATAPAPDAPSS